MIKLVSIYSHPSDAAEFDAHYREVHTPLVRQLPNLHKLEVARVTGAPRGESPFYLIAELYWESRELMDADMASPEMRAVGKDARAFAGDILTMHVAEIQA
jgi:uncharacterized protein (TIGR02118 family)